MDTLKTISTLVKSPKARTPIIAGAVAIGALAIHKIMNIRIKIVDDPVDVNALKERNATRMERWKEMSPEHYNRLIAFQERLKNEPGLAEKVMNTPVTECDDVENDDTFDELQ